MGSQRNITLPSNIGPFLLESLPSGGSAEDREFLLLPWCCPLCCFFLFSAFPFIALLLLIDNTLPNIPLT